MELSQRMIKLNVLDVAHKLTHRLIFVIIISLMVSCSPQKKLQRLIKKHPELIKIDTIRIEIHDTIILKEFSFDTISQFFTSDTIQVIDNSRITLKYYYDTIEKNIYHDVKFKQDTIFYFKEIPFEIEKIIIKELTWWEKNNQWVLFLLVIFGVSLIYQKIKNYLL